MTQAQESCARQWARLRFAVIGPLLAEPPSPRELASRLTELAAKTYRHALTGQPIRFGRSTIERWYYRGKDAADPLLALRPRSRRDRGSQPSLDAQVRAAIISEYDAHPSWTFQLLYDNVRVRLREQVPSARLPSYVTVTRFMQAQGLRRQPSRRRLRTGEVEALVHREKREVRSYEVTHVHGLWHLDFHVGTRLITAPDGRLLAPHLLCIIDDRSRLVCHAQWYWGETAQHLVHGLMQALQKRGLPRRLMTDNGAAMLAEETTRGLANLGIGHETTMAYSPYQNGKQEVFWNQVEGRLLPMLGDERSWTLELLNDATQAWVEMEYQRALHRETKASPLERVVAGPSAERSCPPTATLQRAFTTRCSRIVRRSDGSISLDGIRFEIPSRLRALRRLTVEYARWDLRAVWAVDVHNEATLASLHPMDKAANADRRRGLTAPPPAAARPAPEAREPMAPLLQDLLKEYAKTGLPPAYLSTTSPPADAVTP